MMIIPGPRTFEDEAGHTGPSSFIASRKVSNVPLWRLMCSIGELCIGEDARSQHQTCGLLACTHLRYTRYVNVLAAQLALVNSDAGVVRRIESDLATYQEDMARDFGLQKAQVENVSVQLWLRVPASALNVCLLHP